MKYLIFLFLFSVCNSQEKREKWMVEFGTSMSFSNTITKTQPGVLVGFWYRYPIEDNARLELGANYRFGSGNPQFKYGKLDGIYNVETKEYVLNLGGRMVKEFRIGNQKIEWISELTFNSLFFDGKDIPDTPKPETDENTINIDFDVESISTLQFGQGLRIWKKNLGFGFKANYIPYQLWYKKTVPNDFNVFSTEASLFYKF